MLRPLALAAALAASPALAQDAPVFVDYWAGSGGLPPEYTWQVDVTIRADGALLLKHCKGYETDGPACKTRKAKVAPEALEAIRAAVVAQGLDKTPAREAEYPMVGGDVVGAKVYLESGPVALLSDPADADVPRVRAALAAIEAAIPKRLRNRFLDGN